MDLWRLGLGFGIHNFRHFRRSPEPVDGLTLDILGTSPCVVFSLTRSSSTHGSFPITGAEAKHMTRVLRIGPGERIVLLDKKGARFQAVIEEVSRHHVLVNLENPLPSPPPSPVHITLCQALLKSQHMDLLVEKTSELGVDRVLPYISERTVVKVDGNKAHTKLRHWQEIAQSAAKQSDRAMPAGIGPLYPYDELLVVLGKESALKIILWEQEGVRSLKDHLRSNSPEPRVLALVGPEGGFTQRGGDESTPSRLCIGFARLSNLEGRNRGYQPGHDHSV